ncbi:hypothetical protein M0657_010624 [Pyricularia oryzae]|nr:hypothetical protein M0657_010624 [Pyricularia oryzae]
MEPRANGQINTAAFYHGTTARWYTWGRNSILTALLGCTLKIFGSLWLLASLKLINAFGKRDSCATRLGFS